MGTIQHSTAIDGSKQLQHPPSVEPKSKRPVMEQKRGKPHYKIEAATGKRIYVGLHHHGGAIHTPLIGQRKQEIKDFLMDIWTQFGKVGEVYNHKDFEYAYVTFRTHEHAVFALHGLSDPIQVQAAILDAIGIDEDRAHIAKQLFVVGSNGNLVSPSWSLTGK